MNYDSHIFKWLCALRGFRGDPIAFAARTMSPQARSRLRASIDARVALFALADQDTGGRIAGLQAARARVAEALA